MILLFGPVMRFIMETNLSARGPVLRHGASSWAVIPAGHEDGADPEAAGPTASRHSRSASSAEANTPAPTTTAIQHKSISQAYQ